jgi:hypothetical protein
MAATFQQLHLVDLDNVDAMMNTNAMFNACHIKTDEESTLLDQSGHHPTSISATLTMQLRIKNPIKKEKQDFVNDNRLLRGRYHHTATYAKLQFTLLFRLKLLKSEVDTILFRPQLRNNMGTTLKEAQEIMERDVYKDRNIEACCVCVSFELKHSIVGKFTENQISTIRDGVKRLESHLKKSKESPKCKVHLAYIDLFITFVIGRL